MEFLAAALKKNEKNWNQIIVKWAVNLIFVVSTRMSFLSVRDFTVFTWKKNKISKLNPTIETGVIFINPTTSVILFLIKR